MIHSPSTNIFFHWSLQQKSVQHLQSCWSLSVPVLQLHQSVYINMWPPAVSRVTPLYGIFVFPPSGSASALQQFNGGSAQLPISSGRAGHCRGATAWAATCRRHARDWEKRCWEAGCEDGEGQECTEKHTGQGQLSVSCTATGKLQSSNHLCFCLTWCPYEHLFLSRTVNNVITVGFFSIHKQLLLVKYLLMHLSSGRTSEAEDWGEQHAAVCGERPVGSLPEHRWTGAAGDTAADTDAAGGKPPLIKPTQTRSSRPCHHAVQTQGKNAAVDIVSGGDRTCHRISFLSCFTPPPDGDGGTCSSCFTKGQSQTHVWTAHSHLLQQETFVLGVTN